MLESKVPSVEVAVCTAESSFTQVTVSPTLTLTGFGLRGGTPKAILQV